MLHAKFLLPLATVLFSAAASAQASACPQRDVIFVRAGQDMVTPVEGSLRVLVKRADNRRQVNSGPPQQQAIWIAAAQIRDWAPDTAVKVPQSSASGAFSELPSGVYELQAVLELDHRDTGGSPSPRAWISDLVTLADHRQGCMDAPVLKLVRRS